MLLALRGDGAGLFTGDRVAVLEVEGVIFGDDDFLRDLRRFLDDKSVKAIVIDIDSPGGAVAPSQSIYRELRKVREEGTPVIASIGSVGASGGYYVALGADSIFAMPGSITGSIGAIMQFPNVEELADKVGVSMEVVKSSELKDIGSPFDEMSPEEEQVLRALVLDVYDQFVSSVARERGMSEPEVRRLADGRVLSGRQARALGLVDRLGNLSEAIEAAGRMAGLGEDPEVVRPPEPSVSLLQLLIRGGAEALAEVGSGMRGLQVPQLQYIAY